jgi:1-acyl-sn-glycerol-3-phosphate acyltransferase
VKGLEHVPRTGPVLVVCNHLHNSDPILLSVALPRPLHFMAKKELFSIPVIASIIRKVGAFPVDRGRADRSAIRRADAVLAEGIAVGMFPEGTRSPTRSLRRGHAGAGLLALRSGCPVLPAVITGSERLPGNGTKARRRDGLPEPRPGHRGVRVCFGPTFTIPREIDGAKVSADRATDMMMIVLARMLPPDYRGEYATFVADSDVDVVANDEVAMHRAPTD